MTATSTQTSTPTPTAAPSPRAQFLEAYQRESATTKKVIRAYPAEQAGLKPHETSNSAQQLVWTFGVENALLEAGLKGELRMPPHFPPMADSWEETVRGYEDGVDRVTRLLESMGDEDLNGTVPFMVGPKQMGDVPKLQFAWLMLCDSIHHRGQLSVYLRMTGSKVPSIYGPSRDEPWF